MANHQLDHGDHQLQAKTLPVCFLLNDFDSPANIGSIFRIADAFGIEKIYLTGSSLTPPNSKLRRMSRATDKSVAYTYCESAMEVITNLKADDYKIMSLEITSSSTDIRQSSFSDSEKICLIVGSESVGVSQELLDCSDETLHIPMLGQNSSINVATACAIATFELIKSQLPE